MHKPRIITGYSRSYTGLIFPWVFRLLTEQIFKITGCQRHVQLSGF